MDKEQVNSAQDDTEAEDRDENISTDTSTVSEGKDNTGDDGDSGEDRSLLDTTEEKEIKYDLKLPEDSMLADGALEEIEEFAKKNKLSNDIAQKIVERESNAMKGFQELSVKQFNDLGKQWKAELEKDKEYGGERLDETLRFAKMWVNKFATPALKEVLNGPFGNNKDLIISMSRAGKEHFGEDTFVEGKFREKKPELSEEERWYGPNSPSMVTTKT